MNTLGLLKRWWQNVIGEEANVNQHWVFLCYWASDKGVVGAVGYTLNRLAT